MYNLIAMQDDINKPNEVQPRSLIRTTHDHYRFCLTKVNFPSHQILLNASSNTNTVSVGPPFRSIFSCFTFMATVKIQNSCHLLEMVNQNLQNSVFNFIPETCFKISIIILIFHNLITLVNKTKSIILVSCSNKKL